MGTVVSSFGLKKKSNTTSAVANIEDKSKESMSSPLSSSKSEQESN